MRIKSGKQNKEYLAFEFDVKDSNDDKGIIEGYGSVFGNVDFHNDIVDRGAFRKSLQKVLVSALAAQAAPREVVKQLLGVRTLSTVRARVIARTEAHNAAMFASKRTAEVISSEVGLVMVKRWIPALDERTRFSHASMRNHAPVDMDGKFKVSRPSGGFDMMDRPGDPKASAGNVINCRCVMVYEEKEL